MVCVNATTALKMVTRPSVHNYYVDFAESNYLFYTQIKLLTQGQG